MSKNNYIERLVFEYCPILGLTFYLRKYKVQKRKSKYHK